jgi:hypothetical protein
MAIIKQVQANRRNAQKSTGPGIRAQSAVMPGENQAEFDENLARLMAAWMPQDEFEKSLVEQIAVLQWKLARIDRSEARIIDPSMSAMDYTAALETHYRTPVLLERSISETIADMERYRKQRGERQKDGMDPEKEHWYDVGLLWDDGKGHGHYAVLPRIRGLDGVMREIPAEIMGDFPDDETPIQ